MNRKRFYLIAILIVPLLFVWFTNRGAAAPGDKTGQEASSDAVTVERMVDAVAPATVGQVMMGQTMTNEVEPNGTTATANPLTGSAGVVEGNVYPNADEDFFAITAAAGDKLYVSTMTSFSANASSDSQLYVLASDGTTQLEFDDDSGVFGGLSSSIGGVTLPTAGTYYIRLNHFSATNQLRPYRMYYRLQTGTPTAEVEPNDSSATAQPLPASGWILGSTSSTTDQDWYSFTLNAGDTIYANLDNDPERDTVEWNPQLGVAIFGGFILTINDAGTTGEPDSEAHFMTATTAGTYYVRVNLPTGGTTFGTYSLSVGVIPAAAQSNCTTYTSTNVPQTIPTGPGQVSSTITVPGNPRIADLDVSINLTHTLMVDLDAHLVSPAGNDNGLFTDVGTTAVNPALQTMNLRIDDEAGIPLATYTVVDGMTNAPELAYRLGWFDGEDAGGTWTLVLRDDATNNGGRLLNWSITVCEPAPVPTCTGNSLPVVVYSSDFEANDGGFTHSGTADEWERGLPTFAPITTCNSGTNCWKTDLDNTYNASSTQDLLSPNINLTGLTGPVVFSWAQRYQMENASFDHAFVDVQQVGGATPTRLFEWLDATMTNTVGNPNTTVQESAGWGVFNQDISSYAGQNIEARFHLDGDTGGHYAGLAIDDVTVTACQPVAPAITVDKTVGTDPMTCASTGNISVWEGTAVTYCYTVQNTGDITLTNHMVVDSELGTLLSNLSYSLIPGATAYFTATTTPAATVTNIVTWTASISGTQISAVANDNATVTVIPYQPAVVVTKTVGTDPTACATTDAITVPAGSVVYYCYQVENTGNITFTNHTVVDSVMGPLATNLPYDLTPGATYWFTDDYTIAQTSVTNVVTWTASISGTQLSAEGNDSATVTVIPLQPAIVVTKTVGTDPTTCATTDAITVPAGSVVYYCYQVENTGNVTFTTHTVVDSVMGPLATNLPYELAPGVTYWFTDDYTIDQTAVTNVVTWTAFTALGQNVSGTDSATVTIQPTDVTLTDIGGQVGAGQTVVMVLAVAIMVFTLSYRRFFIRR